MTEKESLAVLRLIDALRLGLQDLPADSIWTGRFERCMVRLNAVVTSDAEKKPQKKQAKRRKRGVPKLHLVKGEA
jgi:hypothetical protein